MEKQFPGQYAKYDTQSMQSMKRTRNVIYCNNLKLVTTDAFDIKVRQSKVELYYSKTLMYLQQGPCQK